MLRELLRGSPGANDELAGAIGAATGERAFGARATERALEGTDERVGRLGWEIDVAALAVGTELKHRNDLVVRYVAECAFTRVDGRP